jgi:hypothetical protein
MTARYLGASPNNSNILWFAEGPRRYNGSTFWLLP